MTDSEASEKGIGQEIVFRVRSTPNGCKVIEYDGRAFADGIMSKRNRRYIYGDDANEKATEYAYTVAAKHEDARVVELGESL